MRQPWICAATAIGFAIVLASAASAQQDQGLNPEDQLAPSQTTQPLPGRAATPGGASRHLTGQTASAAVPGAAMKAVACGGPFAKDSSSLKLAMVFDPKNVTFAEVDAGGSKVAASMVYPKDPKRRLEIWWENQANRSGLYLILINGQSTWTAPGGLKLGLTLAELEKLNHKPFKLKGFDKDKNALVSDWDGGALEKLAGGCKSGVSLQPDPKASPDAISALSADKEFSSNDPPMRELKPKVSEILIGY
jgi:hypothetical protein